MIQMVLISCIFILAILWIFSTLKAFLKYGLLLILLVIVFCIYTSRGHPHLCDAPLSSRGDDPMDLNQKKRQLIHHLNKNPTDLEGWTWLAKVQQAVGDNEALWFSLEQIQVLQEGAS